MHTDKDNKYCNGFDQRIARQRLRKHAQQWSCISVDEFYSLLLDSSHWASELVG
jgi:hypothetical protein